MRAPTRPPLTRIVATLGPASEAPPVLAALVEAGVGVVRLNFSHGTPQTHAEHLRRVRRVERESGRSIAVMGDLRGPRIRVGPMPQGPRSVEPGEIVEFRRSAERGGTALTCTYPRFLDDLRPGDRVLVADGTIRLRAKSVSSDRARCEVEVGGAISAGKGVNLPDSDLSAPSLGPFDRRMAAFAVEQGVDFLAMSFVRSAGEIERLRRLVERLAPPQRRPRLVAKIERPEAVASEEAIAAIVAASDGVMVARGDLGAEMGLEAVPPLQRRILAAAHRRGRPAIVATEVLSSMTAAATPTRAEVGDLSRAVLDGADAIMLSGETAIGRDPALVVATAASILRRAERWAAESAPAWSPDAPTPRAPEDRSEWALARAAWRLAQDREAVLVALFAEEIELVRQLGRHPFDAPIAAVGPAGASVRRLLLHRGVTAVAGPRRGDRAALLEAVRRAGLAGRGTVLLAGRAAAGGLVPVESGRRR